MNAFLGIIYWNDYKEKGYKGSSSKLISLGHFVEPNYLVYPNYAMLAVKNNPKSIIIHWNETSKDRLFSSTCYRKNYWVRKECQVNQKWDSGFDYHTL